MTEAEKFVDEVARPRVEEWHATLIRLRAFKAQWAVAQSHFANDATPYTNANRPDEGLEQFAESLLFAMDGAADTLIAALEPLEAHFPKIEVRAPGITVG